MGTVLLTNAQLRKTLCAVRSLGSRGIHTLVAEKTRFTPATFSRYCGKKLVYPDPVKEQALFHHWLIETLREHPCEVFIPMDDDVMEIVMKHREEIEQLCHLPLPPTESYHLAADKGESARLALEAGIGCPQTVYPANLDHLIEQAKLLKFPLIIKPRRSSGSRGIRVVHNDRELLEQYKAIHALYPWPILQEFIPLGERFDVCLLFNRDGQVRASFVQKELRHFPLKMGPSTMQESVWFPELIEQATALMKGLKWYGIVEIEFMVDPRDGRPKFMEINPRFWNSVHLAVISGVDFPWLLYKLATEGDIEEVHTYQVGYRCRWTLPGDLLHFAANPHRFRMNPPLWAGKVYQMHDDMLSIRDPMPTLGFIFACFRYVLDRDVWKLVFKR